MARTKIVALDMLDTTFSLDRLGRELAERGASAEALPPLFARTLRNSVGDALIAASAIISKLSLLTRNTRHFKNVERLRLQSE